MSLRKKVSIFLTFVLMLNCFAMSTPINVEAATKAAVKKISVAKKAVSVKVGDSKRVKFKVSVKGKASKKISVKVSKKSIAKVTVKKSTIVIKGKKVGKTKVTITTKGKNSKGKKLKKSITVEVKKKSATRKTGTPSSAANNNSSASSPAKTAVPTSAPTAVPTAVPVVNKPDANYYTRGEWVEKLAKKLDFDTTSNADEDLFYYADTLDEKYGIMAEIAHANELLPECDAEGYEDPEQDLPVFEADKKLSKEYATYTIVKALGFMDDEEMTLECADKDALRYPLVDAMAVSQGIISLSNNKFNPNDILKKAEADKLLAKLDEFEESAKVDVSNPVDEVQYQGGVIPPETVAETDYTISDYADSQYRVVIKTNDVIAALKENDIFVLPSSEKTVKETAFKVSFLEKESEGYTYLICTKPLLEEIVTDIKFEGIGQVDVDHIEASEGVEVKYIEDTEGEIHTQKDISFGESTSLPGELKFEFGSKEIIENLKVKGSVKVSIPNVTCKMNAKFNGLSGISIDDFVLSMTEKIKVEGELSYTAAESGYELTNSLGNTRWEGGKYEIGRAPIMVGAGGLSLDAIFFISLSAKGTASFGYTLERTNGLQYQNGSIRMIKDYSQSLETISLAGSIKAGFGFELAACEFGWDVAGFEVEAGLGVKATYTPHLDVTPQLHCGEAVAYLYAECSLSEDALLGKYLKEFHKLSWSHEIYNEEKTPYKKDIHFENMKMVDDCTYGTGAIQGTVKDSDGNPISGARIQIYRGTLMKKSTYTDFNGGYTAENLPAGEYRIKVAVTGYGSYEIQESVQHGQTTYLETLIMLNRKENNGLGTVKGDIINAVTGNEISDVTYNVRRNWNNTTGDILTSGTVSKQYSLNLAPGNYTLQFLRDGFIDSEVNIAIVSEDEVYKDVALSPVMLKDDGLLRVVLTWGKNPADLDSHLIGPTLEGDDKFHVYYSDEAYYAYDEDDNDVKVADLDLDDTESYGPETITLHHVNSSGTYSYYVHDFTNKGDSPSTELSSSNAQVRIYQGKTLLKKFNVPTNQGGTLWHVFNYDAKTGEIIPVNKMSYESSSHEVGEE